MKTDFKPLMVQGDFTILADSEHPSFADVRYPLTQFAELHKNPGRYYTYRITRLSLWNAAAGGISADEIVKFLAKHSKFSLPTNVRNDIYYFVDRYGLVKIMSDGDQLYLQSSDREMLQSIAHMPQFAQRLVSHEDGRLILMPGMRGEVKQALIKVGIPVQDLAGYHPGEPVEMKLSEGFALRDYQAEAVEHFLRQAGGGSGVVVLPCGAGKTVVGIGVMAQLRQATLILTTNVTSVRQWMRELRSKTSLQEEDIGEYSGECKEVKPITVATYQILTHRANKEAPFAHMNLFNERDWGLIIYDEVHLLPAPVFRATANLQATRRLGLTATLIREDGLEEDVFSLVGPRCYYKSWKALEEQGWISRVKCTEIRVAMSADVELAYMRASGREKIRIAAENARKLPVLKAILDKHRDEPTLIIGGYIKQLKEIAAYFGAPMISGQTSHLKREQLYAQFKAGQIPVLIVSKVANFAVDLPDAAVAVQVSGSFGSRQEEAQRLGRIIRPKQHDKEAHFYSIVTLNTREQQFAHKRQLFLAEQGYEYSLSDEAHWIAKAKEAVT